MAKIRETSQKPTTATTILASLHTIEAKGAGKNSDNIHIQPTGILSIRR